MLQSTLRGVIAALALLAPLAAFAADLRLVMVEQPGCAYCARWNAEVAPIYPKTPEGKAAPLERVDLRGPYPWGYTLGPRPVYTPTFIVTLDGAEQGRIEGYPGDDFFWGLLGRILTETGHFTLEPTKESQ